MPKKVPKFKRESSPSWIISPVQSRQSTLQSYSLDEFFLAKFEKFVHKFD